MPFSRAKLITATGNTDLVCDWMTSPFGVSVQIFVAGGVTTTYALQSTLDDVMNTPAASVRWTEETGAPAGTAVSKVVNFIDRPVVAVRCAVATLSGGNLEMKLVQGM